MTSEARRSELHAFKSSRPERLIALYGDALGVDLHGQLPSGIGFGGMIEAIIEYELATGQLQGAERQLHHSNA